MLRYALSLMLLSLFPFQQHSSTPGTPLAKNNSSKIQVALLLDTSNSMDGLIDQAKAQLWKMVNKLSDAKKQGQDVVMEIALYEYGNDGLERGEGYIRMVQAFGMDLDGVSEQLFKLKTNGGQEYCGWVIKDALADLKWSEDPNDLRIIVIAGNEPFDQGPEPFQQSCKDAAQKGISINTIHCGPYDEGERTHWKDGAILGNGRYMVINTDEKVIQIPTPYDKRIIELNESLNNTYIGYGRSGRDMKSRQMEQDANAYDYGVANMAQRATAKAKKSYNNAAWDLVDAYEADSTFVKDLKKEDLPENLQGKSEKELSQEIQKLSQERAALQKELLIVEAKMQEFIAEEQKKMATTQTLDNVLIEAIVEQAREKGFEL